MGKMVPFAALRVTSSRLYSTAPYLTDHDLTAPPDHRRRRLRADDLEDRQLHHPIPSRAHRGGARPAARRPDRPGRARLRRRHSGGRLDARGVGPRPHGGADRHRAQGRSAPDRVARVAGRGARRRLRHLERAAQLPGRRPDPRRQGQGEGADTARPPPAAGGPADRVGTGQGRGSVRRAHGRDRLQRRQDDRAASAHPRAERPWAPGALRAYRADRHHDRRLGHRGRRGGGRLHRRRGRVAHGGGEQGRGRRAGGGAGEHQPSGLLRGHPRAAARLVSRRDDPLPPVQPAVHRGLPRGRVARDSEVDGVRAALRDHRRRGASHEGDRHLAQHLRHDRRGRAGRL